MRSAREITFRLRQEAANLALLAMSPPLNLQAATPLAALPAPTAIADAVRSTRYADDLIRLADPIVEGRIPIFETQIEYGNPPVWRRDPLRGIETPAKYFRRIAYLDLAAAGDHKWIWELNRHQYLVLLAQAFLLTGKTAYLEVILRHLQDWWAANPFQHGINWASALEVGLRSLSWIWIWHLVGDRMPEPFRRRFLGELYLDGLHLEHNLSVYFSPNTHLLGEAVALHAIGRLFPHFPRSTRWRSMGRETVAAQMTAQVRPDGSHFEQSTYYHLYALDMFLFHAILEDVTEEYRGSLGRMAEYLACIVGEDGALPLLGDDDGGRLFHPYGRRTCFSRATLATASVVCGRSFFPYSDDDVYPIAIWWLGAERCRAALPASEHCGPRAFRDSGLAVMRRGDVVALFDAGTFGPWGAGHSHADSLSLVISAGDEELLIDPGTYSYLDLEWRDFFRGAAAHNTVRIDNQDQAVPDGPFRWRDKPAVQLADFTTTAERDSGVGVCSYRGFTHKRTVTFDGGELHVVDELNGPPGLHLVEQFWHVGSAPEELGPGVWRIGARGELYLEGSQCEDSWRSRGFGAKEKSFVIVVRKPLTFPASQGMRLRIRE